MKLSNTNNNIIPFFYILSQLYTTYAQRVVVPIWDELPENASNAVKSIQDSEHSGNEFSVDRDLGLSKAQKRIYDFTEPILMQAETLVKNGQVKQGNMNVLLVKAIRDRAEREKPSREVVKFLEQYLAIDPSSTQDRELNCQDANCKVPITLSGIWGYGCWCNFGVDLMKGNGLPMNEFDNVCKNMQLCLRCARMDGTDENEECDPKTQDYNAAFSWFPTQNSLGSDCSSQNNNHKCSSRVCTCEIQLINDLMNLIWSGIRYSPIYQTSTNPSGTGTFSQNTECEITNGPNSDIQCCGKYPFRYTYNNLEKDCCEASQEVFNPVSEECCPNGVQPFGNAGCSKK